MPNTKFGLNQFNNKTPKWAKMSFYVATAIIGVAMFIISGDPGIPAATTVRIMVYLKGIDMLLLALSKMFGTEQDAPLEEKPVDNSN